MGIQQERDITVHYIYEQGNGSKSQKFSNGIFLMIQQIFIAVFYTCQMGIFLDNIPSKIRYSTKAIIANISSAIASLIPILYRGEKAKFYHKSTPEILIIILVFSFISLVIFKKNSEKN